MRALTGDEEALRVVDNGMSDIERRVELGMLMDFYGPLLSERIAGIMRMYVVEDYGLSEIAQAMGISRQGVYDAVRRGTAQLMELEQRLGLERRHRAMADAAQDCREALERVEPQPGSEQALERARALLERMRDM